MKKTIVAVMVVLFAISTVPAFASCGTCEGKPSFWQGMSNWVNGWGKPCGTCKKCNCSPCKCEKKDTKDAKK